MKTVRIISLILTLVLLVVPILNGCIFGNHTEVPVDTAGPSASVSPSDIPNDNTGVPDTKSPSTDSPATGIPSTDLPATGAPQSNVPTTNVPTTNLPTQSPTLSDGRISIGDDSHPARNTMPVDLYGLSEAECEDWFSDAVFVGDSLTIGWKSYNNLMLQSNPKFFGETRFLCEGSYGVGHALDPVSDTSLHPIYGGAQHQIWDSINMMGAKKVFLLFGLNDLTIWGVEGALENYTQVIDNIAAKNPNAEIYIVSAMYMYKGSERDVLNNANLYKFNCGLNRICNQKGLEFVNIASNLIDEDGYIPDEYSSDHYVHQTYKAYAVWAEVLRSLAARHILNYNQIIFE